MQKDTQQELERLERELLAQEDEEISEDELLDDIRSILGDSRKTPAFDDPQTIHEPEGPLVYRNYSNDYGREPKTGAGQDTPKPGTDRITLGLMITASVLSLGIIGVLIYWLVAYL